MSMSAAVDHETATSKDAANTRPGIPHAPNKCSPPVGRNTWRTDRYSPCPRPAAGTYLAFLASLGYQLSAIESAVTRGTPYAGDEPAEHTLPPDGNSPSVENPDRELDPAA